MTLRFGTDGIRGRDVELAPELVVAVGRAAARALPVAAGDHFVVGRDTRRSGPMIESALAAGLAAEGVVVERLGVLPTPGVARAAAATGGAGAMISASHNVFSDNGIKFFAAGGRKLSDEAEARFESVLDTLMVGIAPAPRGGASMGTVDDRPGCAEQYVTGVLAALEGRRLDGLSVVLDPAHGAAWSVGPELLRRAGALVEVINAAPDGVNINRDCGSTAPDALCRAVVAAGADLGLALDGDADRVIAVDHRGEPVDGDHLIALLAIDMADRDRLRESTVVVTVMSNLGLRRAMAERGITVVETPVGDRHVLAALERGGWSLGGEQSGHVIVPALAGTGDGLLTGLLVADLVRRSGQTLAALSAAAMTRLPQVLRAIPVDHRDPEIAGRLAPDIAAVEAELGDQGRVLLRASGTEPVIRVMVEAPTVEQAERLAGLLAGAVERVGAGAAQGGL